jgi:hypothetical protein
MGALRAMEVIKAQLTISGAAFPICVLFVDNSSLKA